MKYTILILSLFSTFPVFADEPLETENVAVLLETPRGRTQTGTEPILFKWIIQDAKIQNLSVKIYQALGEDEIRTVGSYEILSTVTVLELPSSSFPPGDYSWEIHSYQDKSAKPTSIAKADFYVEQANLLNLKTNRLFATFSSSRGTYETIDPNFTVSFDTTPIAFGGGFAGGTEGSIYQVSYSYTDFTVQGALQSQQAVEGFYQVRLFGRTPFGGEFFAGPKLRMAQIPFVSTANGVDILSEESSLWFGGLQMTFQTMAGQNTALFASAFLEMGLDGADNKDQLSYEGRLGVLYNLKWPFGIEGNFTWRLNEAATGTSAGLLTLQDQAWGVSGRINYSF